MAAGRCRQMRSSTPTSSRSSALHCCTWPHTHARVRYSSTAEWTSHVAGGGQRMIKSNVLGLVLQLAVHLLGTPPVADAAALRLRQYRGSGGRRVNVRGCVRRGRLPTCNTTVAQPALLQACISGSRLAGCAIPPPPLPPHLEACDDLRVGPKALCHLNRLSLLLAQRLNVLSAVFPGRRSWQGGQQAA